MKHSSADFFISHRLSSSGTHDLDSSFCPLAASSAILDDSIASSAYNPTDSFNVEHPPQPKAQATTTPLKSELVAKRVDAAAEEEEEEVEDYTKLPSRLDDAFDRLDEDHAVRPAIIKPGDQWQRARQKALILSKDKPNTEQLSSEDLSKERHAVFDMLDALTRSGALPIENAEVHIVIGAIHRFDNTVINTVVQRNMNPIESMERSSLIMASTLFQAPSIDAIVQASQVGRLRKISTTASSHADE